MAKTETQGQVTEATEVETIDPFANDDTEPEAYVKLDVRRAEAVESARSLLGDEADTSSPEEAILALRKNGHPFYVTMKGSPRQTRKFKRDYRATLPEGEKKSARISKANGLTDQLAEARNLLSQVRKASDAEQVIADLQSVKALADSMIEKIS